MIQRAETTLCELYEADETAWLDAMAELIRDRAYNELDYPHLMEFLTDMARRDRREVESRLTVLLKHVLKWVHQPDQRSRSWHGTILEQQSELAREIRRGVLRNHAESVLDEAYTQAIRRAAAETGLATDRFPAACPYSIDQLLAFDPVSE